MPTSPMPSLTVTPSNLTASQCSTRRPVQDGAATWATRTRAIRYVCAAATMVAAMGCSGEFAAPSLVETVRILAVRATPPQLPTSPSETTTLEAKVVGMAPGEPLCHAWGLCLLTTTKSGGFTCLDPALELHLGTSPTVEVRFDQIITLGVQAQAYLAAQGIGGGQGSKPGGTQPDTANQPISVVFGAGEKSSFAGGCPASISDFLAAGCKDRERCVIGSKTLRAFTTGLQKHQNPTLTELTANGAAMLDTQDTEVDAGTIKFVPSWSTDSMEKRPDDGGPEREGLLMSWFSTNGRYDKQRSFDDVPDNSLKVIPASGEITVWVVVRDGRGGVDWLERRIRVK